jgi:hypothetical protein
MDTDRRRPGARQGHRVDARGTPFRDLLGVAVAAQQWFAVGGERDSGSQCPTGRKPIEIMIGSQLGTGVTHLQRFTAEWIEENG